MKIIGYSERGAMNALFYGMAIKKDDAAMNKFLSLAGINDAYSNFRLYIECSLSDFGDPDLVIIADKDGLKNETVFFVEAKVSERKKFDLKQQQDKHDKGKYDASNLFFQLRSKEYFFNHECKGCEPERYKEKSFDIIKCKKEKHGNENCRELGKNGIVNKFADEIKKCKSAEYIAIIPEQKEAHPIKSYGFPIRFISWETICSEFGAYIDNAIVFNQYEDKNKNLISQVLNNPMKQ